MSNLNASEMIEAMHNLVREHVRRMTPQQRGHVWRAAGVRETHFYAWLRGDGGRDRSGRPAMSIESLDAIMSEANVSLRRPRVAPWVGRRSRWIGVDWSKSDAEIAREVGVTRSRAYHARHEIGCSPPPVPNRRGEKWAGVDWSKSDAEIARQMGVTRQRVYQVRKARGTARN